MLDFKAELERLKAKDNKDIRLSEELLRSTQKEDEEFNIKVQDVLLAMEFRAMEIYEILKDFLDNPLSELFFGIKFNDAVVISILKDEEFVAFMLVARLYRRTLKLTKESKGDFKLRLYAAILNFDSYKKGKWCD